MSNTILSNEELIYCATLFNEFNLSENPHSNSTNPALATTALAVNMNMSFKDLYICLQSCGWKDLTQWQLLELLNNSNNKNNLIFQSSDRNQHNSNSNNNNDFANNHYPDCTFEMFCNILSQSFPVHHHSNSIDNNVNVALNSEEMKFLCNENSFNQLFNQVKEILPKKQINEIMEQIQYNNNHNIYNSNNNNNDNKNSNNIDSNTKAYKEIQFQDFLLAMRP